MILKINGEVLNDYQSKYIDFEPFLPKNKKEMKKFKKLSTWLWSVSGTILMQSKALAANNSSSMWMQMQPLWQTFQEIAMVVGGIALFIGLITFIFKRSVGKSIIMTSVIVVGGCFLVPSAIMLLGIVGHTLNNALTAAFQHMNLQNSVPVGN